MAAGSVSTNIGSVSISLSKIGNVNSEPVNTSIAYTQYEEIDYSNHSNENSIDTKLEEIAAGTLTVIASTANLVIAFGEGVVSFGEALWDTGILAETFIETIGYGAKDILDGILKGDWSFDDTKNSKNLWKDRMAAIAVNQTSNLFSQLNGEDTWLNEHSHDAFKRGNTFYEISKGVGYYTGVTTVAMLTGGASASGSLMSQMPNAIVAGTAQLGKSSQKNYNDYVDTNYGGDASKLTSNDISAILTSAVGEAALEAGTAWITRDGGAKTLANNASNNITKFAYSKGSATMMKAADKIANAAKKTEHLTIATKSATQAAKEFVKEGIKTGYGVHSEYDFEGAKINAASAAIGETIAGYTGNGGAKAKSNLGKPLASKEAMRQIYTSPGGAQLASSKAGAEFSAMGHFIKDSTSGLGGKIVNRYIKETSISASEGTMTEVGKLF